MERMTEGMAWLRQTGRHRTDAIVDSSPRPHFQIADKTLVAFCSNNYLGLSRHPAVLQAAKDSIDIHGIGTCESRALGGNLAVLEALEADLARLKHKEKAVVFATGLMANVGAIPAIAAVDRYLEVVHGYKSAPGVSSKTVLISDELSHYSIRMGVRLSDVEHVRFRHADLAHLEDMLRQHRDDRVIILTDSVFSMDGDLAPLPEMASLAEQYGAGLMIDDAHGTGVLGEHGGGTAEHFGISERIDIIMGTLSKALGGIGGFIAASASVVELVRMNASTYIFTSSLPPEQAYGLRAAVRLLGTEPALRQRLWRNTFRLHVGLRTLGLQTQGWTPIVPVLIGAEDRARQIEGMLYDAGLYTNAITFPMVHRGAARLRLTTSSMHTREHIDTALEVLETVAKRAGLPLEPTAEAKAHAEVWAQLPPYIQRFVEPDLPSR